MIRRLVAIVAAAGLLGCATVQSGALTLDRGHADADFASVKTRAALDQRCPKDRLALTALRAETIDLAGGRRATRIEVDGCGKQAVYVRREAGRWVWLVPGVE